MAGAQRRSSFVAGAKGSSRRVVEPLLKVHPISIWSLSVANATPSPPIQGDAGNDRFGAEGGEDSLFTNAELAVGLFRLSFETLISRRWKPCSLRRLLPYHSREPSLCVRAPSFIRLFVMLMLSANSILFLGRRLLI